MYHLRSHCVVRFGFREAIVARPYDVFILWFGSQLRILPKSRARGMRRGVEGSIYTRRRTRKICRFIVSRVKRNVINKRLSRPVQQE